jgi:hypothetical protein
MKASASLVVAALLGLGLQACSGKTSRSTNSASSQDSGSAGTAGAPLLVDDQSSLSGRISLPNGGAWDTFPFGTTATIVPPPNDPFVFSQVDAGSFSNAACMTASGITGYGAGEAFTFQIDPATGGRAPYNASAYSGVSFYAMSPDTPEMEVYFWDTDKYEFWPGATCAGGADAGPVPAAGYPQPPCGDPAQAYLQLSPSWTQIHILWSQLQAAPGGGYYVEPSLDVNGLLIMGFQIPNPNRNVDGGAPLSFTLCIAQIYLTP